MPRLITDDAPRRLRGVWLGPKGVRWPVDWTFAQWGVFAALMIACPLAIFFVFVFLNWYLAVSNGLLWGPVAAYFLTKWVMGFVDYDRPLRFWFRQIRGEWKRSQRTPQTLGSGSTARASRSPTWRTYCGEGTSSTASDLKEARRMRRPRLPRLARSHRAERVAELTLATKQITGHLQMTDGGVWAWYMLAPQLWAFTTDADRERIWSQVTHRFAALRGHGIRLRVSSKPFPAYEFARGLARDTPNPLPRIGRGRRRLRHLPRAPAEASAHLAHRRQRRLPRRAHLGSDQACGDDRAAGGDRVHRVCSGAAAAGHGTEDERVDGGRRVLGDSL